METEFVRSFLLANGKYFPENKLNEINTDLELSKASESIVNLNYRNATLFTILYWFVPLFWAFDRFFVRDYFGGVVKALYPTICLFGGIIAMNLEERDFYVPIVFALILIYGLWVLIDGITIFYRVRLSNYRKLRKVLGNSSSTSKMSLFPLLMLLILIASVGYGVVKQKNKRGDDDEVSFKKEINDTRNNGESTVEKKVESTLYYEHSCGENEVNFDGEERSGYGPLPVYLPNHPNHPDYDEKVHSRDNVYSGTSASSENDNPFGNSDSYGTGSGDGQGIGEIHEPKTRRLKSTPNFDDLEVFEKCRIEYRIMVDERGIVRSVQMMNYQTFVNEDGYTWKEKRERKRVTESLLNSLKYRIQKQLVFEVGERNKSDYIYVVEFETNPLKSTVSYRPLS